MAFASPSALASSIISQRPPHSVAGPTAFVDLFPGSNTAYVRKGSMPLVPTDRLRLI